MVLKYPSMPPPHRPVLSGKMEAGITMTKMENLQKDGIRQNPGPRYYFGKTGAAKSGILTVNGKKYCFTAKGKMLIAWQTIDNKTYFFDLTNGYMHTGWLTTPAGNKYYFWNDGVIRSGFHRVKNVFYCFNKKGKMLKTAFRKMVPLLTI